MRSRRGVTPSRRDSCGGADLIQAMDCSHCSLVVEGRIKHSAMIIASGILVLRRRYPKLTSWLELCSTCRLISSIASDLNRSYSLHSQITSKVADTHRTVKPEGVSALPIRAIPKLGSQYRFFTETGLKGGEFRSFRPAHPVHSSKHLVATSSDCAFEKLGIRRSLLTVLPYRILSQGIFSSYPRLLNHHHHHHDLRLTEGDPLAISNNPAARPIHTSTPIPHPFVLSHLTWCGAKQVLSRYHAPGSKCTSGRGGRELGPGLRGRRGRQQPRRRDSPQ